MYRKISSPSRPASVATMMLSHLLNTSSITLSCLAAPISVTIPLSVLICLTTSWNGSGSIGKSSCEALPYPYADGMARETRCPNANGKQSERIAVDWNKFM